MLCYTTLCFEEGNRGGGEKMVGEGWGGRTGVVKGSREKQRMGKREKEGKEERNG